MAAPYALARRIGEQQRRQLAGLHLVLQVFGGGRYYYRRRGVPTQVFEGRHEVAKGFAGARAGLYRVGPALVEGLGHEAGVGFLLFTGLQLVAGFGLRPQRGKSCVYLRISQVFP